jgi:acetyl-CoA synthetase
MDAYWRNGTLGDHKQNADVACELAAKDGQKVDTVLVWQRYPGGLEPDTHGQGPRPLRERRSQGFYGARVGRKDAG